MKKNLEIRTLTKESGLKLWQVAEKLNLSDGNFSRKLRREFSDVEKSQVFEVIHTLIKEKEN